MNLDNGSKSIIKMICIFLCRTQKSEILVLEVIRLFSDYLFVRNFNRRHRVCSVPFILRIKLLLHLIGTIVELKMMSSMNLRLLQQLHEIMDNNPQ